MNKLHCIITSDKKDPFVYVHFCEILQRAAQIEKADPKLGITEVSEQAELWFPISPEHGIPHQVYNILVKHKVIPPGEMFQFGPEFDFNYDDNGRAFKDCVIKWD